MIILNKLYGGEVELRFDSIMHRYSVDGKKVPGVTSIIGNTIPKPALMFWSANMASDYWKEAITPGATYDEVQLEMIWANAKKAHTQRKEDAGTVGTFTHRWVESYIKGEKPELPINPQVLGAVQRFMDWVKQHDVKFLSAEQPVFSKKYNYCGTADFFCFIDGELWLGDLKTSNAIYDEMKIQTSAYLEARLEEYPTEKYAGCVIVRVGKEEGEFDVCAFRDTKKYSDTFYNCLALNNSLNIIKPPKYQ